MADVQLGIGIILILSADILAQTWVEFLEPPTKAVTEKSSRLATLAWFKHTDPEGDLSGYSEEFVAKLYWKAFNDLPSETAVSSVILEGKKKVDKACYECVIGRAFGAIGIFSLFCTLLVSADVFGTKNVPTEVLTEQFTGSLLEAVEITVGLIAILGVAAILCALAEKSTRHNKTDKDKNKTNKGDS